MSNETIIALLQNQLADLETQLTQLLHRADTLRNTINTLKSEVSNLSAAQHQAIVQAQAANDLAKSALHNAQEASAALTVQRDEINAFIEHTAQQIENLAIKAQAAIDAKPCQTASEPAENEMAAEAQATVQAIAEQEAEEEEVIEEIVPQPIDEEPTSEVEEEEIVADLQKAQEQIAEESINEKQHSEEQEEPAQKDFNDEEPVVEEFVEEQIEDAPEHVESAEFESDNAPETIKDETTEAQIDKPLRNEQPDQSSIIPKISDIKAGISIGDRFLFQRQLFRNSGELMNKTITRLNAMSSFEEAMAWCEKNFEWDKESNAYELFTNVLRRRW